ncbi:MAG TPA: metalloregulator ArsR/SmtB family transcription factor [Acidimicrobiales bacterium]|nr:metalloregulator ArsR/SmtB family transcription factor [Acidimicrobiales bacterium]
MSSQKSSSWPALGQTSLEKDEAAELARLLGALADPIRLRLVSIIAQRGATCACDLVEPLERSQPTISHHTKVLAEVGLLRGRKHGRSIWWTVDTDRLALVTKALGA